MVIDSREAFRMEHMIVGVLMSRFDDNFSIDGLQKSIRLRSRDGDVIAELFRLSTGSAL